jgi:hypothetical protein
MSKVIACSTEDLIEMDIPLTLAHMCTLFICPIIVTLDYMVEDRRVRKVQSIEAPKMILTKEGGYIVFFIWELIIMGSYIVFFIW